MYYLQILHSENITGLYIKSVVRLQCNLFGSAGYYFLRLKSTTMKESSTIISKYMKV